MSVYVGYEYIILPLGNVFSYQRRFHCCLFDFLGMLRPRLVNKQQMGSMLFLCPKLNNKSKMKKITFTVLSVFLAISAFSQVKVALLEPRAGEGSDPIAAMEKAMIRGEMRKAIIQMEGYEAFTRSDIDQMMQEQDFQRSGNVSDADIHRMGEMSGADFICVTTITKSSTEFYIEVYLIDVETGKMASPASQYGELVNGKFSNLLPVCRWLAAEMTGKEIKDQPTPQPARRDRESSTPDYGRTPQYERPTAENTKLKTQLHIDIQSRPAGADVYWRVVSSTDAVKNQNSKYLGTTPYESTDVIEIQGLNRQNASQVQIEIKCEKSGYYTQTKRFSMSSLIEEKELSVFFKLVQEE